MSKVGKRSASGRHGRSSGEVALPSSAKGRLRDAVSPTTVSSASGVPVMAATTRTRFVTTPRANRKVVGATASRGQNSPVGPAEVWEAIKQNLSTSGQRRRASELKAHRRIVLYVMVKSGPRNKDRRATCRSAWQLRSSAGDVTIPGLLAQFFLIGKLVEGEDASDVNKAVIAEEKQHHDILLYPGNDTYRRLPWKVLWGFQHALRTFDFDMILLCDDDSFINYAQVLRWIGGQLPERVYAGHLVSLEPAVQRDKKNPWYVSREVFAQDHYPPYHWGAGYFMSRDLVNASLMESFHHDILWIDDVFIGLLLNATGLQLRILDIPVYAQPDWKIFLCCEPSPLILGSRKIQKMKILGTKHTKNDPLCRLRKSKYCMRQKSL